MTSCRKWSLLPSSCSVYPTVLLTPCPSLSRFWLREASSSTTELEYLDWNKELRNELLGRRLPVGTEERSDGCRLMASLLTDFLELDAGSRLLRPDIQPVFETRDGVPRAILTSGCCDGENSTNKSYRPTLILRTGTEEASLGEWHLPRDFQYLIQRTFPNVLCWSSRAGWPRHSYLTRVKGP